MKRIYVKPETVVVAIQGRALMLSASESAREVGGDPTNNGMPGTVGETDDDTDPYGGHGQGSGGGGNRSKGSLWGDWDDDLDY
jgi:hypothetical protein